MIGEAARSWVRAGGHAHGQQDTSRRGIGAGMNRGCSYVQARAWAAVLRMQ